MFSWLLIAVGNFVNSPGCPVDTIVLMALAYVRPVEHEYSTVHIVIQFNPPEPQILRFHEVRFMLCDVTRSGPFDSIAIDPAPVKVCSEYLSFVFVRPLSSLVDHHSAMSVASSRFVRT